MVQIGRDFDLTVKPLRSKRGGLFGPQDLDRHLALMLQVFGEMDRRHPTAAQRALDGVAVG